MAEPHSSRGSHTFNLRPLGAGEGSPDLEFDPPVEESQTGPANREQPLEQLREQQRLGWRSGQRPSIESFLVEHPGLTNDPLAVFELIWGEFLAREEQGEKPVLAEYQQGENRGNQPRNRAATILTWWPATSFCRSWVVGEWVSSSVPALAS
jgi:hypothetical protein